MTERSRPPKSLLVRMTEPQYAALKASASASGMTMTEIITSYIDSTLIPQSQVALTAANFVSDARRSYASSVLASVDQSTQELSAFEQTIRQLSGETNAEVHEE